MKAVDRFADALFLSTALIVAVLYFCVAMVAEPWPQRLVAVAGWLLHSWVFARVATKGFTA